MDDQALTSLLERLKYYPGNDRNFGRLESMLCADGAKRPIAFVGAGLSVPLFPSWSKLLKILQQAAIDEGFWTHQDEIKFAKMIDNPLAAASMLRDKLGESLFLSNLVEIFDLPPCCNDSHKYLMQLPIKAFATTNFDRCLSYARSNVYPDDASSTYLFTHADDELLRGWVDGTIFKRAGVPPIVHLHGVIDRPTSLILDEDNYQAAYNSSSDTLHSPPFIRLFEQLWFQEKLIILGFSGQDPWVSFLARETLNHYKWPASDLDHIAIVPLPLARIAEVENIRREFRDCFHAGVVFFDPTEESDRPAYLDLTSLLELLTSRYPGPSVLERRRILSEHVEGYCRVIAARLREMLVKVAPKTAVATSDLPIDEIFWIPEIEANNSGFADVQGLNEISSSGDLSLHPESGYEEIPQTDDQIPEFDDSRNIKFMTVFYGPAGAGKSVLCLLLALGLVEKTGLGRVTDALPELYRGRDIPILIDLRRYADVLLDSSMKGRDAVLAMLDSAWGVDISPLLDAEGLTNRFVLILDGLEALFWASWAYSQRPGENRSDKVLAESVISAIRTTFPGVPIIANSRPFAKSWLKKMDETVMAFEITPLNTGNLKEIVSVHKFGSRTMQEEFSTDRRLPALLYNRSLVRFASTPLFVKRILEVIQDSEDVNDLTVREVVGGYLEQMIIRGLMDQADPSPKKVSTIIELLRQMAYLLVSTGSTALDKMSVLKCGKHIKLGTEETKQVMQWLGDRTSLITLETHGGISFAYDWDIEYLAAEKLVKVKSAKEIVALATNDRWRESVQLAASLTGPKKAETLIGLLLEDRDPIMGLKAASMAMGRLSNSAKSCVIDQVRAMDLSNLDTRLAVIEALAEFRSLDAQRLLVRAALPIVTWSTENTFQRYVDPNQVWDKLDPNTASMQVDRVRRSDHLSAAVSVVEKRALVLSY